MDAVRFIEERNRMCKSFGDDCVGCPANDIIYRCKFSINVGDEAAKQVELLEEWAAAHPRKTRQSEFLKQWPDAMVYSDGVLDVYPCILEKARRCDKCNEGCTKCRHEFWMQEVE